MTSKQDNWDQHWEEYHQSAEENPAQNYRREVIFSERVPVRFEVRKVGRSSQVEMVTT